MKPVLNQKYQEDNEESSKLYQTSKGANDEEVIAGGRKGRNSNQKAVDSNSSMSKMADDGKLGALDKSNIKLNTHTQFPIKKGKGEARSMAKRNAKMDITTSVLHKRGLISEDNNGS